jgi:hypothetical protein
VITLVAQVGLGLFIEKVTVLEIYCFDWCNFHFWIFIYALVCLNRNLLAFLPQKKKLHLSKKIFYRKIEI